MLADQRFGRRLEAGCRTHSLGEHVMGPRVKEVHRKREQDDVRDGDQMGSLVALEEESHGKGDHHRDKETPEGLSVAHECARAPGDDGSQRHEDQG